MSRPITPATTLDNLKAEAKRWLKALRAGVSDARARLERALGRVPAEPTLRDVQLALAREHGMAGWSELKERVASDAPLRRYERVAEALVTAYRAPDPAAMEIVWEFFGHRRTWDVMRRYLRLGLGRSEVPAPEETDELTLEDARYVVARSQELPSWAALVARLEEIPPGTTVAKAVEAFSTGASGARRLEHRAWTWEEVEAVLRERALSGLQAHGQMTDAVLERITRLEHVTALDLSGSKALTDRGLQHLRRLPHLRHLYLNGCGITDRGLEVLGRLPELETLELAWTSVTDAGAAHLAACDRLARVDLSGTRSGDGAIRALGGKPALRHLRTGNGVTDAGLAELRHVPAFRTWQGGEPQMGLVEYEAAPTFLMLRGTFGDAGMEHLRALEGLFALNIDDRHLRVTERGIEALGSLPHLWWLAFDATDATMPSIGALPHLRFLMCQDTSSGDDGFSALARSRTLEFIWGRRCYNLGGRGFRALAGVPTLRGLSVSLRNVGDDAVATLPAFPALRELMPMDLPDEGYRHIGRCEALESLVLMYCRETGDVATRHIARLPKLRKYFVSYNRITDETPRLLSGIESLEDVTIDSCAAVTNAGVAALARLPRLRRLSVSGMRAVTDEVKAAFRDGVEVRWAL